WSVSARLLVQDLCEDRAVLALQVHIRGRAALLRRAAAPILSVDEREAHQPTNGWCNIDVARCAVVQTWPDAGAGKCEWGARLHDVERPVLAWLAPERKALRTDDQVGRVRAIEELRDAFVGVRVGDLARLDEGAVHVLGRMSGRGRRRELVGAARHRIATLVGNRVGADLLDDGELGPPVAGAALEAHHPARGPDLIGVVATRD